MAISEDWAAEAARQIFDEAHEANCSCLEPDKEAIARITAIINKHCPFKPDTAYMSVAPAEP